MRLAACTAKRGGAAAAAELGSRAAIGRNNKDSLFTVASSSTVVGVKLGPASSAIARAERRPEAGPEAGRRPTHTATKPAKVEHKSG